MSQNPVYLDYNATAPLRPESAEAIKRAMTVVGNPSSVHRFGRETRKMMEMAREQVADAIKTDPTHITFVSGATEANNSVLSGSPAKRIFISAIEHDSLLDAAYALTPQGYEVHHIPVSHEGVVDLEWLRKKLYEAPETETLISVMMVNNETGVIQPIEKVVEIAKGHGQSYVHSDAVQALGRIPVDFEALGVDYISLSAHKIGGPAGIGALVYDHDTPLQKYIHGGGQERRRRAGTENFLGAVGFGAAAQACIRDIDRYQMIGEWRDATEQLMAEAVPEAIFFGRSMKRVPNTIQVSLPAIPAEKQLMNLDLSGLSVSSGSACSSGSIQPSHVLSAMGVDPKVAEGALRISAGWDTMESEMKLFGETWIKMANKLLKGRST